MNIYKIILTLLAITLVIIIYQIFKIKVLTMCPKPTIKYRYIPRTFKEEQDEPIPIKDVFDTMFAKPSPWMISRGIGSRNRLDTKLDGRANNFV